jgi:hypothetical protein
MPADREDPLIEKVRLLAAERDELQQVVDYVLARYGWLLSLALRSADPRTRKAAAHLEGDAVYHARLIVPMSAADLANGRSPNDPQTKRTTPDARS